MYMVSLNQAAGIAREEMTSLDGITAELLNFIQLKSQRLYMHSLQVANYSVSIAAKLMLPKSEIEQIKYAALLHDVGLLVVSNTLLVKIPYLNRSEMAQYKRHAAAGGNMLESIPCCQDIVPYSRRNFGPRQKNKPSANSSAPQASSLTRKWSRPSLKS
ncbi:HDIG domain protein [Megasphaera sp. MJR8396C]|nr:HDIG domain protein [Megasphaera sp. MJR8396C]